jgi:hypothetical protein
MKPLAIFAIAVSIAASSVSVALAADPAQPTTERNCFRVSQITNHTKGDNKTLYFGVRSKEVYRVGMSGNCLAGTTSSDPLILETHGGIDLVCRPLDLDLKVKLTGGVGATPCIIRDITKLGPEAIAALPPRIKP